MQNSPISATDAAQPPEPKVGKNFNLAQAAAVNVLYAWLACTPQYGHHEPPTEQEVVDALVLLAASAAARYDGGGVNAKQMRALFAGITMDRQYGLVSTELPLVQCASLEQAVRRTRLHTEHTVSQRTTITGPWAPTPQHLGHAQRAADEAARVSDVPETFEPAPVPRDVDPRTALPAGVDVHEFGDRLAGVIQYLNAAVAVSAVTTTAHSLRDNAIPDHREAGRLDQAEKVAEVVEEMLADQIGFHYRRSEDGRARLPLAAGWPYPDQPWEPVNDAVANVDKAMALLQRVRAWLVSPTSAQGGGSNA